MSREVGLFYPVFPLDIIKDANSRPELFAAISNCFF
jgi:hypothetical protein